MNHSSFNPNIIGRRGQTLSVNRVTLPAISDIDHQYVTIPEDRGIFPGLIADIEDLEVKAILLRNGNTTIQPYRIVESPEVGGAVVEDSLTMTGGSTARDVNVGSFTIPIDDTTPRAEDYFKDGTLWVIRGAGSPYKIPIKSNTATSANEFVITLYQPIQRKLLATGTEKSKLVIIPSLYRNIQQGGANRNKCMGITRGFAIDPNNYFWAVYSGETIGELAEDIAATATLGVKLQKAANGELALYDTAADVDNEVIARLRQQTAIDESAEHRAVITMDVRYLNAA